MKDNRPPKEERTLKRGDTREDGMVFWGYSASAATGEAWLTRSKFDKYGEHINSESSKLKRSIWSKELPSTQKEKYLATGREYYRKNKEKVIQRTMAYTKRRYGNDPTFRLASCVRKRLSAAVTAGIGKKCGGSLVLTGCSWEDLRNHLESKFSEGMTWENYGLHGWHVDHIKPCASFDLTLDSEQRECFHYTNLQPLWANDNWKKGDKHNEGV